MKIYGKIINMFYNKATFAKVASKASDFINVLTTFFPKRSSFGKKDVKATFHKVASKHLNKKNEKIK